jgi:hypothetical protein
MAHWLAEFSEVTGRVEITPPAEGAGCLYGTVASLPFRSSVPGAELVTASSVATSCVVATVCTFSCLSRY